MYLYEKSVCYMDKLLSVLKMEPLPLDKYVQLLHKKYYDVPPNNIIPKSLSCSGYIKTNASNGDKQEWACSNLGMW
jgi:hypothetical protein